MNSPLFLWDPCPPRMTSSSHLLPWGTSISCLLLHVRHELQVVIFLTVSPWSAWRSMGIDRLFPHTGLNFLGLESSDFIHFVPLSHPLPSPHANLVVTQKNSRRDFKPHCVFWPFPVWFPYSFSLLSQISLFLHSQALKKKKKHSFHSSTTISLPPSHSQPTSHWLLSPRCDRKYFS